MERMIGGNVEKFVVTVLRSTKHFLSVAFIVSFLAGSP